MDPKRCIRWYLLGVLCVLASGACSTKAEQAHVYGDDKDVIDDQGTNADDGGVVNDRPVVSDGGGTTGEVADAGGEACAFESDCPAEFRCGGAVGAPGTCRPFPDLDTVRILVLGSASHLRTVEGGGFQHERPALNLSGAVADVLRTALHAAGHEGATVTASELPGVGSGRLLEYMYAWTDRDARLAELENNWDVVAFFDNYYSLHTSPEMFFEATRVLSERIRAAGAIPMLVMHSDARPTSDANGMLCNNRCAHHNDGGCSDFPWANNFILPASVCAFGTDCTDCRGRSGEERNAPQHTTEDLIWRIGVGTGSVVVPAGISASNLDAHFTEWPFVAGAGIFTALTGRNSAESTSELPPAALTPARWEEIGREVVAQEARDRVAVHFEAPFSGAVRINQFPVPEPYRVLISGTSSERGFLAAMRAMLMRENIPYVDADIGRCSPRSPSVSRGCFLDALKEFEGADFHVMYARNYEIHADEMLERSGMPGLMPQMYDRHWDDTQNDGVNALDELFTRSNERYVRAALLDIAWLPQHINFAKLKAQIPSALLLSDGVHATRAVQAGLASMSWTSYTGRSPSTTGLDPETAAAIRLGEHTIRTLSTLSGTGEFIPDLLENRRVARAR